MIKKRIVAVLAAFALCCSLTACGGGSASTSANGTGTASSANSTATTNGAESAKDAFVGTWDMVEFTNGGTTYNKDYIEKIRANDKDSFLVLNADGNGTMVVAGSRSDDFSWEAPDNTTVKIALQSGITMNLAYDGTQLAFKAKDEGFAFEKGEPRASIPEKAASSSSVAPSASAVASSSSTKKASKYEVSIDDMTVGEDYQGNPALIVTYSWKNNSDKSRSFASALHPRCYQSGVQLSSAIVISGIDNEGYLADVKPGYGTTLQMAYELKDTENPVDVEVYEFASFKGDPIVAKTYKF